MTTEDETSKRNPDTLSGDDQRQSLDGKGGSTSPGTPRTFTEQQLKDEVNKARNEVMSEAGKRYKPVEDENKTLKNENAVLKSQLANNQTLIKSNQDAQDKLQKQIDDLSADDPDKQKFVKKLRDLESQEQKLKDDRAVLENDKTQHADTVKLASDTLREIAIWEIAADYEGGDPAKLKDLCDTFGANDKEQITKIAKTLWTPIAKAPPPEPGVPPVTADNGETRGGGTNLEDMSPTELIKLGLKQQKQKKK